MQITDLLARLRNVTGHADGGYLAACPAHADRTPSLRLWHGENGTVRVTCRSGCTADAVRRAMRVNWTDMFNVTGDGPRVSAGRPAPAGSGPIAALAVYTEATNAALADFENPASESARRYLGTRFGLDLDTAADLMVGVDHGGSTHPFPYLSGTYRAYPRLTVPLTGFDNVVRGLQGRDLTGQCPARWVSLSNPDGGRWGAYGWFPGRGGFGTTVICEGPGDALTAVALGYNAVAIRGASLAGNPELAAELAEGLRGMHVVIAGDQDQAGQGFTERLAAGLAEHGIDAYRLDIPVSGGDLTDWRAADLRAFPDALHRAVKAARPVRTVDAEAERRAAVLSERTGADFVSREQGVQALEMLGSLVDRFGESDAMHAYALVAWTNGRIKFSPGLGFYAWDGRVWVRSATLVRQQIHRMGAALALAGNPKAARAFLNTSGIESIMTELKSVPSVYIAATAFDSQPDLLSFRNGTVNLRTGHLRPHDPDDLLTYCLDLDYRPEARCPRWESFLGEIFPGHPELSGYMRRLIGYGVTGHTSEQAFVVLFGGGANGKSVLTDTLTHVFRALVQTTPFATFEEKPSGGIPNDLAALRGCRLALASEGESGRPMSEAVLKRTTGKDMISARFLRQEFFEYKPSFLLLLATNHKPKFRSQDAGLWRRVKLVPFARYFAPQERDHTLDAKLLLEAEGIAAWAVRGAIDWYRDGLCDPEVITGAVKDYKQTSDQLAGFFPDVLEPCPEGTVMDGTDAFNAYLTWCEAENLPGRERWTRRTFYSALEERGIPRKRVTKGMALVGIREARPAGSTRASGIFAH
ncbi:phage/plasmid primase, P4 family [Kitasatospora sp. NBC_00070]|uniref:phage/plasmid primase, P4 family n=1 Tax=Kitasatospora sp. NBC_00070 TaxID=2975962 RepID=UPI0032523F43